MAELGRGPPPGRDALAALLDAERGTADSARAIHAVIRRRSLHGAAMSRGSFVSRMASAVASPILSRANSYFAPRAVSRNNTFVFASSPVTSEATLTFQPQTAHDTLWQPCATENPRMRKKQPTVFIVDEDDDFEEAWQSNILEFRPADETLRHAFGTE
jgi:hypothetical protein